MNWYSNPTFWSLLYEWMFPPESFAEAREQAGKIQELAGLDKGAVLDLCCGPGRFSIPLAQAGFEVTAVDLDGFLLGKAREYAAAELAKIEFLQADMKDFRRRAGFDLIISMYSSFGYFEDSQQDRQVLANCFESLRPGGRLLLDVRGKEIHAMSKVESVADETPAGALLFQRSRVCDGWSRTVTDWVLIEGERVHRFEVRVNLYSGQELKAMLEDVGFGAVHIFGDLGGRPYDMQASRLVALAEKT